MSSSVPANTVRAQMIKEANAHVRGAESALRKGCEHALLAGLRLHWLHRNSANPVGSNQHKEPVSRETGFEGALREIDIKRATAYRWINATLAAADKLGYSEEEIPAPDSLPDWRKFESQLIDLAQGMSLRRLVIGCAASNSEDQRQDELIARAEAGDMSAEEALERIASGELTLVQAMRAAAGALATKGKERKDPVYLDFNVETRRATGLLPKALITLQNGFKEWESYSPAARAALRSEWEITRGTMPDDLFSTSKK